MNNTFSESSEDDALRVQPMTQAEMMSYPSITARIKSMCERINESDVLSPQFIKKYISYAKHTVFPKLSIDACEVIKDFYISLRENAVNN